LLTRSKGLAGVGDEISIIFSAPKQQTPHTLQIPLLHSGGKRHSLLPFSPEPPKKHSAEFALLRDS
jgi:hypothetical protein